MTGCREAEELMSVALDGMLDTPSHHHLERHLTVCPECARLWGAMNDASTLFRASDMLPAPAGFTARVLGELESRHAQRRRWLHLLTILTGSTVLWITLGLLIGVALMASWTFIPGLREVTVAFFRHGWEGIYTVCWGLMMPMRMLGRVPSPLALVLFSLLGVSITALWVWLLLRVVHREPAAVPGDVRILT